TSGAPTIGASAVPVNTLLPAISGVAEVGQVLTAYEGKWTGGVTSFAYRWLNGGEAIVDATNKTYTLVSGDAEDEITVEITASNSAGAGGPVVSAPILVAAEA